MGCKVVIDYKIKSLLEMKTKNFQLNTHISEYKIIYMFNFLTYDIKNYT